MTIETLQSNIAQEKSLIEKLDNLFLEYQGLDSPADKKVMENAIASTQNQLKILNNSIPDLLSDIKLAKKLPGKSSKSGKKSNLITLKYNAAGGENLVAINSKDKDKYLEQLNISNQAMKDLKKRGKKIEDEFKQDFKSPNYYIKYSNKFFGKYSDNLIEQGYFTGLKRSLQKGGFAILLNSYVAMMLFTTFISIFVALFLGLIFLAINIGLSAPFISLVDYSQVSFLQRFVIIFFSVLIAPALVFLAIYFYPSTEQSSIEQKVDYELPFATIQMAAIAGANIEPSNIFRIIALNREYPNIKNEAKKLLNQINLYGYSLVTALRNSAQVSPSKAWADLLNGISTTIRSGGNLSRFLSKRAETLLFEYRIQREKATKFAETFMDIYISVVIAAPMMIMLLLVMMSISGLGSDLSVGMISLIIVSIVSVINIFFLMFLQLNQKKM